jgi:hypothetical protein
MKAVILFAAAIVSFAQGALAQSQPLSPAAEFDLNMGVKPHHFSKYARSFIAVTSQGMTLVTIDENHVSLTSADLDGRVLSSKTDLASVNTEIYSALPRPDGSVWLLSGGPHRLSQDFSVVSDLGSASPASHTMNLRASGATTNYTQMDLYNPAGEHLAAARLLAFVAGAEVPIAAAKDEVVLRTQDIHGSGPQTLFHFGTIADGKFSERTQVKVVPPVAGGLSLIATSGDFVLINRVSGSRLTINPKTKNGTVVRLSKSVRVKAAASDSDYVYLLTGDSVLKTDPPGRWFPPTCFSSAGGLCPLHSE